MTRYLAGAERAEFFSFAPREPKGMDGVVSSEELTEHEHPASTRAKEKTKVHAGAEDWRVESIDRSGYVEAA